ncbi:MAG: hypothetical protein AEth_00730 [Candidatus Argoarchaeum ethanivorans]|uniref:Methanolan biosynthesis EpsI domain-containing protein n=1 Tax=Candidatus Argoarchaeum ethanivorans TaxID=2608793 RepID=A0A8B6SDE8_9EURY|nr:MAG: hypothetical protein AEth_00730 [Candidatus Argoarchaeum ethanivorans]
MKNFFEEYSKIIGLLVLAFVIIFLFSTPSTILAKSITTIGTELSHATEDEMNVRTKMDFGSNEHMRTFPKQIGDWNGSDYNTTRAAESLGADVILMRAYSHPKLYQPVFFLIVQSNNRSSFHPPIVCYPALGYTIEEEGKERVPVQNVSWVEEPLFRSGKEKVESNITTSAKKLIVVKESNGNVTERRVVLYYYVKDHPLASNTVTMVRVSALAPIKGSYDGILNITKEFMGDTVPYMFEIREEGPTLFTILASGSATDKVMMIMLFLAPFIIIFYKQLSIILRRK